jgi:hypothetical protein
MSNKKYKLLKDLPYAKKGAIYNVDNNGNYVTMDVIDNPIINHDTLHKHTVENNPEWFELITEPSIQPERIEIDLFQDVWSERSHKISDKGIFHEYRLLFYADNNPKEKIPAIKQAIENVLNDTVVEDKPFLWDERLVEIIANYADWFYGNHEMIIKEDVGNIQSARDWLNKYYPKQSSTNLQESEEEFDWEKAAEDLWQLLDDIDTASDMFKPITLDGYKTYYSYVSKKHALRFNILKSDGYKLFIPKQFSEIPKQESELLSKSTLSEPQPSTTVKPEWEIVDYGYTQNNENIKGIWKQKNR